MKITTEIDKSLSQVEVMIRYAAETEEVRKLYTAIRCIDTKIPGQKGNATYAIPAQSILYIESVNRKTFLYTVDETYETKKKLYELEQQLAGSTFFRVSKPMIVNLNRVRSLRPELGSRILLTMDNGERIVVSRQYAHAIRNALEV